MNTENPPLLRRIGTAMPEDGGAAFVADLLKKYGWGVEKLKRHYDWTGKDCPRILINKKFVTGGMNWRWFIKAVKDNMEGEMVEKSAVKVDGKRVEVRRILKDGTNYIKIRDIAKALDLDVSNKGNVPILNHKGG